jgi:hypothetical protein
MKQFVAILIAALVAGIALAGCGGSDPSIVGKWSFEQPLTGKIQNVTFTPDGVRYVEGLTTFDCWEMRGGKMVMYGRAVNADAETAATVGLVWNGADDVTLDGLGNDLRMLRTSTDGELSAEGKRVVVEKTLGSDAGGCKD